MGCGDIDNEDDNEYEGFELELLSHGVVITFAK